MKPLLAFLLSMFMFGCSAEEVTIQTKPPDPLSVKIAKECQPAGAECFIIPAAALQELEERFSKLKEIIREKNNVIKELQEYQSKTCI